MTCQHTPGPWKLTGGGGVSACMESETLKSGRRVARRVACAKGLSIEEVSANARLIAAAPDLRESLEQLLIGIGMGWELDGLVAQARTAIAKAS